MSTLETLVERCERHAKDPWPASTIERVERAIYEGKVCVELRHRLRIGWY